MSLVLADQGLVEKLQARQVAGNLVSVDWVSFTFIPGWAVNSVTADADLIGGLIGTARRISDWGDFDKNKEVGVQGFRIGRQLDDCIVVGAKGAGPRVYMSFSGQAFVKGDSLLPRRIHDFLEREESHRITRLDLAFDDFEGRLFSPWQVKKDWYSGHFDSRGRRPRFAPGGDFERGDPDGRGVTAYVGSLQNGKELCVYEKGKQLGDAESKWVRAELRFSQVGFSIDRSALLNPTAFFCGGYPYLSMRVAEVVGDSHYQKFERVTREGIAGVEKVLDVIKTQYGRHLDVLRKEFFMSDAELLDALCNDDGKVPKALEKALMLHDRAQSLSPCEIPF